MTGTQERAVTAMRAIGDTVTGAPPLRLPPRTAASTRFTRLGRPASRAWRLWLVPAAAAVAVVAIALSLAVVRSAPKESAAPPSTAAPSAQAGTSGSASVPPYYVTLPAFGWYAYAPPAPQTSSASQTVLVVGETATGKRLATVTPPHGMTFNVVSGAADDRAFVVGATSYSPGEKTVSGIWFETWYLLRISPGTAHVAQLTQLRIPVVPNVTGIAISPEGTMLAVAYQQFSGPSWSSASGRPQLGLWSVATGRELDHWSSAQGRITATPPAAGSRPDPFDTAGLATALRWTPDGGGLAYAWNGSQIRLLDFTAQGPRQPDLVKASRLRAGIGDYYTPAGASFTCVAADGWSLSTGARTFTCAGSYVPMRAATGPGCGKNAPAHPALFQQIQLGDGAQELTTLAQSPGCVPAGPRAKSAALGWSSADGSRVIAMLGDPAARDDKFGVFTKKTFNALPAVMSSGSLVTVAW
ncbi:hypothetical protein EAS64_35055 [Trebonia kvetii]|uniref:WD40 repeat domain-containing protein n=1 Tax=Trebonia kvetii TaxID=2480626 RepID=A0A6P2BNN1_9ACTN|nr:hypothetical protein [Trebonia kvetii]TVZ00604.1 hypothetical protein EAS64_35055 [Trebonia kvetii]